MTAKAKGIYAPDQSLYITLTDGNGTLVTPGSGSGTVTSVSVATANGVSGSVATATTTPAITLTLGAITPTSVAINGGTALTTSNRTGTGNLVLQTSPTLTTPVLGVATATSMALGGATLGTNTLAVASTSASQATFSGWDAVGGISSSNGQLVLGTNASFQGVWHYGNGNMYFDNTFDDAGGSIFFRTRTLGTVQTPLSISGTGLVTVGQFSSVNTTGAQAIFSGWDEAGGISTINGQINLGSDATFQAKLHEGNGILYIDNTYNNAAGNISIRTRTAGTPINAITINGTGEVTVGSTIDSSSTATGSLQVQGGAVIKKRFWIPAITTSAGLQTAVLCQSSGGEMIADSVACLASSARFKNVAGIMEDGALDKLSMLPMRRWSYKPEGMFHNSVEHIGPIAEDVAEMDSRLVGYDTDGSVRTYSTEQLLAFTIKALQEMNVRIDRMDSEKRN